MNLETCLKKRIDNLKNELIPKSIIIIANPVNCYYLTQFPASSCYIVLTSRRNYYITDGRYFNNAVKKIKHFNIIRIIKDRFDFLKRFSGKVTHVCIEKDFITLLLFKQIKRVLKAKFLDISNSLSLLRSVKDKIELKNIRKAGFANIL